MLNRSMLLLPLAASLAAPAQALACGGFFCSSVPMDQSKERIIFAIDEAEGSVETHVQIFYEGAAAEFAWIVPVPAVPELGLSIDALFQALDSTTQPWFWLEQRFVGDCQLFYPPMEADSVQDEATNGGGVTVIAETQVGPYDTVTLQATSEVELLNWLQANEYVIPDAVGAHLAPYVAEASYFIALKLSNDRDAGDIAPIKFTYQASAAMIPLVLTAIAATPDMRLQPYVFADARAVPDNYLHVQINEAAIDWIGGGSNYDAVITQAANEAGGQAFATDFSGPTDTMRGMLWAEGRFDLDLLRSTDDPATFVSHMLSMAFPRTPQVQNLIRTFIPMPASAVEDGLDEASFYNCLDCYPEYLAEIDFAPVAFANTLDEVIVTPLEEAEALFWDNPVVTRMTSSMSPDEMTSDPQFILNPDMGPVSNQHTATLVIDCTEDAEDPASWVTWIELQDGTQILLPPGTGTSLWGGGTGVDEALSSVAASAVEDTTGSGPPTTVTDNAAQIADAVASHNAEIEAQYDDAGIRLPDGVRTTAGGCGCDTSGRPGWALAAALGLLTARRRRA